MDEMDVMYVAFKNTLHRHHMPTTMDHAAFEE